jgi:hypothetical protein
LISHGYLRGSARNIPSADGDGGAEKSKTQSKPRAAGTGQPLESSEKSSAPVTPPKPKSIKDEEKTTSQGADGGGEEEEEEDDDNEEEDAGGGEDEGVEKEGTVTSNPLAAVADSTPQNEANEDDVKEKESNEDEGTKDEVDKGHGEGQAEPQTNDETASTSVVSAEVTAVENAAEETEDDGEVVQQDETIGEGAVVVWSTLETIVELICKCKDIANDDVQLQVVKVLLTLMTTSTVELHEAALMIAVQACYHIHLTSKNQVIYIICWKIMHPP